VWQVGERGSWRPAAIRNTMNHTDKSLMKTQRPSGGSQGDSPLAASLRKRIISKSLIPAESQSKVLCRVTGPVKPAVPFGRKGTLMAKLQNRSPLQAASMQPEGFRHSVLPTPCQARRRTTMLELVKRFAKEEEGQDLVSMPYCWCSLL
jgi:hypothetical protein